MNYLKKAVEIVAPRAIYYTPKKVVNIVNKEIIIKNPNYDKNKR